MKKFNITIDVTMSGDIEIDAETEEQAREIALQKSFVPSDLRFFHFLTSEIYDVEEIESKGYTEKELVPMPCNYKAMEEYLKR